MFGLPRILQLQFEMRENPEQRIVDFVGCSQRQLRQSGELLVLGQLGFELKLLLDQFALLFQAANQRLLGVIALVLALRRLPQTLLQFVHQAQNMAGDKPPEAKGQNQSQDVGIEKPVELLFRDFFQGCKLVHARVVDQYIQLSECLLRLYKQALHIGCV